MTENEAVLFKKAAQSLRTLVRENQKLSEETQLYKKAMNLAKKMVERDRLSPKDVLSKIAEFVGSSYENLCVTEKALDLQSGQIKLGSVGGPDPGSMDAEDRFINSLFE